MTGMYGLHHRGYGIIFFKYVREEKVKEKKMGYDEIEVLKQSEKSTVQLVKGQDNDRLFIRKTLQGRHPVYRILQELSHPYLPSVYEVSFEEDSTIVVEEYIEGQTVGSVELSEKQCGMIGKEICNVLIFLHENGIIHRDIKPSNILLAKDGHIRLIDFDAARMPKENSEQDTIRLGTRGYAPPEQYGFSQTDERADIYAFGVTMKQLLGGRAGKPRYRRVLSKCMNLDPNKRYRSVYQVKKAFLGGSLWRTGIFLVAAAVIAAVVVGNVLSNHMQTKEPGDENETGLIVLPAPADAHWDGETGTGYWGCVFESGVGDEQRYDWRLYRRDTATPPDLEKDAWDREGIMRGNVSWTRDGVTSGSEGDAYFCTSYSDEFWDNGFYYFAVRASGDGVTYADSPYVLSDAFAFTGEDAPELPVPEGLHWIAKETDESRWYFGAFTNWDDYEDKDVIDVYVYKENGEYVMNTMVYKKFLLDNDWSGVRINQEFVGERGETYRFAIRVHSSRPNEYRSSPSMMPCPEESYLSPPLDVPNPLS